jgi:hypothetical protein
MLDGTGGVARDTNWSMRRSIVVLSLVGIGGWCLLAGVIWLL